MSQPKVYESHAHRQAAYRRRCQEASERQLKEQGLPTLPALSGIPGVTRWQQAIERATSLLSTITTEMEEYYDDRSERWQDSDRGESFRERIDAVADVRDAVADVRDAVADVRDAVADINLK